MKTLFIVLTICTVNVLARTTISLNKEFPDVRNDISNELKLEDEAVRYNEDLLPPIDIFNSLKSKEDGWKHLNEVKTKQVAAESIEDTVSNENTVENIDSLSDESNEGESVEYTGSNENTNAHTDYLSGEWNDVLNRGGLKGQQDNSDESFDEYIDSLSDESNEDASKGLDDTDSDESAVEYYKMDNLVPLCSWCKLSICPEGQKRNSKGKCIECGEDSVIVGDVCIKMNMNYEEGE